MFFFVEEPGISKRSIIHPPFGPCAWLPAYLSNYPTFHLSIYSSIDPPNHSSIHPAIRLSFLYLSEAQFIFLRAGILTD
jgi:hypothetical protein